MERLRAGLAALLPPESPAAGLAKIAATLQRAAAAGCAVVCFPEAYLPGLRGTGDPLPPPDGAAQAAALDSIRAACRASGVAAVAGLEWVSPLGLENRAFVVGPDGAVLGHQTKNQITPGGEAAHYVPDGQRRLFRLNGVTFGIVICHEGWRYPETVRWAAVRGARVIFQPQWTGSHRRPSGGRTAADYDRDRPWGRSFYEQAMACRAQENSVYFASVNQAMRYQNSATSLIDPAGRLVGHVPYGVEDLLVADLDLSLASGYYARRYNPAWYPESPPALAYDPDGGAGAGRNGA